MLTRKTEQSVAPVGFWSKPYWMLRNLPFRVKLLLGALPVALIPLIIISYFSYTTTRQALVDLANETLESSAVQTADNIDKFIETNLDAVSTYAQIPDFQQYLELPGLISPLITAQIKNELQALSRQDQSNNSSYALLDENGVDILDTDAVRAGLDVSQGNYYEKPFATGYAYVSPVKFSPTDNQGSIYFSAPIQNSQGKTLGYLRLRFGATVLQQIVDDASGLAGNTSFAVLLDEHHMRLADGEMPDLAFKTLVPLPTAQLTELRLAGRLPDRPNEQLSTNLPDFEKGLSNATIQPFFDAITQPLDNDLDAVVVVKTSTEPWLVVFAKPQRTFLAAADAQAGHSIFIGLFMSILVIILAAYGSSWFTRPIINLTAVAQTVGEGNLDIQAEVMAGDEIGELAKTFNAMVLQLKSTLNGLAQRGAELLQANENLQSEILERERAEADLRILQGQLEDRILQRTQDLDDTNRALMAEAAERRQAEDALRLSEENYRLLFEGNPLPMWLYDPASLAFLAVNDAAIEHYGYSRDEFLNMTIKDIRPNEELSKLQKNLGHPRNSKERSGPWVHRKKNGKLIEVEVISHEITFAQKQGRLVLANDITERLKAEERLKVSEKRFRSLVEQGTDEIVVLDETLKPLYMSPAVLRASGQSEQEILHAERFATVHPDDQVFIQGISQELIKSFGSTQHFEIRLLRKDGTWRWVEGLATNLLKDQSVGGILLNYHDVTERKQTEEKIRRQLGRLGTLREIDQAILSSFDLKFGLDALLGQVMRELAADAGGILLFDSSSVMMEYVARRGFRSKNIEKVEPRLDRGFAGRAILESRMIRIFDIKTQPSDKVNENPWADEVFASYIAVPLIAKGFAKGALEILFRSRVQPDQEWIDFLDALAGQASIAIESVTTFEKLQRSNAELIISHDDTIEGWSRALDLRDNETEGHTQRVTAMTLKLAKAFDLSEREMIEIRRGALLHDIGKMGIPDNILLKPGPLTDEEWVIMKKHPTFAYEMLSPIHFLRGALDIPHYHHEKWDGTGYPDGLKGTDIPLAARIFAAADVWDALRSDRPYRAGWPKGKVMEYIRSLSGTHFEPEVVEKFLEIVASDEGR